MTGVPFSLVFLFMFLCVASASVLPEQFVFANGNDDTALKVNPMENRDMEIVLDPKMPPDVLYSLINKVLANYAQEATMNNYQNDIQYRSVPTLNEVKSVDCSNKNLGITSHEEDGNVINAITNDGVPNCNPNGANIKFKNKDMSEISERLLTQKFSRANVDDDSNEMSEKMPEKVSEPVNDGGLNEISPNEPHPMPNYQSGCLNNVEPKPHVVTRKFSNYDDADDDDQTIESSEVSNKKDDASLESSEKIEDEVLDPVYIRRFFDPSHEMESATPRNEERHQNENENQIKTLTDSKLHNPLEESMPIIQKIQNGYQNMMAMESPEASSILDYKVPNHQPGNQMYDPKMQHTMSMNQVAYHDMADPSSHDAFRGVDNNVNNPQNTDSQHPFSMPETQVGIQNNAVFTNLEKINPNEKNMQYPKLSPGVSDKRENQLIDGGINFKTHPTMFENLGRYPNNADTKLRENSQTVNYKIFDPQMIAKTYNMHPNMHLAMGQNHGGIPNIGGKGNIMESRINDKSFKLGESYYNPNSQIYYNPNSQSYIPFGNPARYEAFTNNVFMGSQNNPRPINDVMLKYLPREAYNNPYFIKQLLMNLGQYPSNKDKEFYERIQRTSNKALEPPKNYFESNSGQNRPLSMKLQGNGYDSKAENDEFSMRMEPAAMMSLLGGGLG